MISLEGKRIFVTGAAAGMGRSIAELSAAAGAEVLATDVAKEGLAELEAKGIQTAVLDATDKDAIDDLFGRQAPSPASSTRRAGCITALLLKPMMRLGGGPLTSMSTACFT